MLAELEEDVELEDSLVDFYTENFTEDVQFLVKVYLAKFFEGREMHCGGKIPACLLYSARNISLVLNTCLEKGIQKAYRAIEIAGSHMTEAPNDSVVAEDVKLVIAAMRSCACKGIPQEWIPGIVLLYLEYCEGVEFEV